MTVYYWKLIQAKNFEICVKVFAKEILFITKYIFFMLVTSILNRCRAPPTSFYNIVFLF